MFLATKLQLRSHGTLAQGLVYFNQAHYWEAHEIWEQSWRGAVEPYASLYRGLIQAAAALVHWQRGNPRGLVRNWYKARPMVVAIAGLQSELELTRFIYVMDQLVLAGSAIPQSILITYNDDITLS